MVLIDSELQRARILYGIAQQHGIDVTEIQKGVSPEGVADWYQQAHLGAMEERNGESVDVDPSVRDAVINFSIRVSQALSGIGIDIK